MFVLDYPKDNDDTKTLLSECYGFVTNYGLFLTTDETDHYLFFDEECDRPQLYHCNEYTTIGDELKHHFPGRGYELRKVFKNKEEFIVTFSYLLQSGDEQQIGL